MQTQDSVDSFAWQWTQRTVVGSKRDFYRQLFASRGVFHDYYDGKVVADVGSGMGRFTWALAEMTRASRIISVELAAESVAKQRAYIKDPRVEIVEGDIALAKFKADVIWCAGVIQHTADPLATLRNLVDNLNEGGELLVSFYLWTPTTIALEPLRLVLSHVPRRLLWALTPFLAPIFMVRPAGRTGGLKNAMHTAYDWFGGHRYQHYATERQIHGYFRECGIHPNNILRLSKGLYRLRKGAFPRELEDSSLRVF